MHPVMGLQPLLFFTMIYFDEKKKGLAKCQPCR
jgi:hypothetical protein